MADKKLTSLTSTTNLDDADILLVSDVSEPESKKITWSSIKSLIQTHVEAFASYFNVNTNDSDDITEGSTNLFFTTAEQSKLAGIETSADVTDEANVTDALDGASLTAVTIADDDKILIQDTSDSDVLKTATRSQLTSTATQVDTFTSSGTYTKPTDAVSIKVQAWGGSGGGGTRRGGGGGGGAYFEFQFDAADIGATETVTVGAGGAGGVGNQGNGSGGGSTSFGSHFTVGGGGGGVNDNGGGGAHGVGGSVSGIPTVFSTSDNSEVQGPFEGGVTNGANSIYGGGAGASSNNAGGDSFFGGGGGGKGINGNAGGSSVFGGAGGQGAIESSATAAQDGSAPGGGGGGGSDDASAQDGGSGADGKVIVTTYFSG